MVSTGTLPSKRWLGEACKDGVLWSERVGRGGVTNQYQRSTWSVCNLSKLPSMAFRMYSGSLDKMRVPSAKPLRANLVARKTSIFSQHHTFSTYEGR